MSDNRWTKRAKEWQSRIGKRSRGRQPLRWRATSCSDGRSLVGIVDLTNIPSAATCAQMAYELGVITTIQLMERILGQNGPICLSWDATTVDGAHINEIHLTLNRSDCLTLDVRHIPGGKASDYVSHIVSSLTEAADTYSRFKEGSGYPAGFKDMLCRHNLPMGTLIL
ncbi:hypothetical protein ElyMa_001417700 [Elysia marginata]|uniref:Uncharacterized protein n=1 Tax=Elysia marginata TaxID=1093978 RepID=A0AAV4IUT1_9GAST|nr:hypothetical protein ElyMa_001417700 [Elysia marginata]